MRQLFGQERTELATNGLLAGHSEKLLHAGVPGLDVSLQVNGEDADIQGLDDVFAEVLKPRNFEGLLFERAVKLGVIESDCNIAANGFDQLDVIAGEKVSIHGFTQTENGDGVFADAAGNKIVQVELLERATNGVADISCRTG